MLSKFAGLKLMDGGASSGINGTNTMLKAPGPTAQVAAFTEFYRQKKKVKYHNNLILEKLLVTFALKL